LLHADQPPLCQTHSIVALPRVPAFIFAELAYAIAQAQAEKIGTEAADALNPPAFQASFRDGVKS